ncbi:nucleotidyltransferase domain-containing protein [Candidatus Saganbacteria bacterium]|nr:nucleotidyltransferase domain-containing protein [Candidatus Saganbacteria bacterium]
MLSQEKIKEIAETIKIKANPNKIYLFGSYALGKATNSSDLDILVIDDSNRDKKALALEISKSLFPRDFGLDLLVTSSKGLKAKSGLNFWREITIKSKKLYERN